MDRRFETATSEIAALQKSEREIQRAIRRRREQQLKGLPELVALNSVDELIKALAPHASSELRARLEDVLVTTPAQKGKRYGADMRRRVREELEAGKSLSRVAAETGVSMATVMKWKKQMGLQVRRHRRLGGGNGVRSAKEDVSPHCENPSKPN